MADKGQIYCPKHLRIQRRNALAAYQPAVSDVLDLVRAGTHRLELRPYVCTDATAVAYLAPVQGSRQAKEA